MSSTGATIAQANSEILTVAQRRLVQATLPLIERHADQVVQMFYARLFELDPELKPLFKGDIKEQGRKLFGMVRTAVRSLERLEAITPNLKLLGNAHRLIGVKDKDFDTFGAALLWTLEQNLKSEFTPDVKAAWSAVYAILAAIVKGA